jgi:hypothetical protein
MLDQVLLAIGKPTMPVSAPAVSRVHDDIINKEW